MEYYVNSKTEEETIYEIYKACRLCGAGAGYKMPIIQNVVNLATDEIELKQKISECVQIEVHQDDKMPPLICELCVDKVNDFYEFMDMCKQTNKKTRLRLGLPPQTLPRGAPDAGDCILGVTEPVYINEDSNEAILTRKSKTLKNIKTKKEPEAKVDSKLRRREDSKLSSLSHVSALRSGRNRQPSPKRLRGTKRQSDDELSLNRLQKTRKPDVQQPKSILKKINIDTHQELRAKRSRDSRDSVKSEVENKKVKVTLNIPKKPSKPEPKPLKASPANPARSPPQSYKCQKCKSVYKTAQALSSHARTHTYKTQKRKPSPPARLEQRLKTQRCSKCDKNYPTNLFKTHKCMSGQASKCDKCKRKFQTKAALASHERSCRTSSGEMKIPRELMSRVRPLQVRLARCDSLLDDGRCRDVSAVKQNFGLDKECIYPYINKLSHKLRIKSELAEYDSMVNIQDEIRDEFDLDEYYVHWDSESENDTDAEIIAADKCSKNNVKQLSTLSLKVLFSPKFLGKVPKKLRRIKSEKPFDSILNASELECDIRRGIDNIIDSLEDTTKNSDKKKDDDSLFDDNKGPGVKNSDFDLIFKSHDSTDCNEEHKDTNKIIDDKVCPSLDISEVDDRLSSGISDESSKLSSSNTETDKLEINNTAIVDKNEIIGANGEVNINNKSGHDSISLVEDSVNVVHNNSVKLNKEHEESEIIESTGTEPKEGDSKEHIEDKEQLNKADDESKVSSTRGDSEGEKEDLKENMISETIERTRNNEENKRESDSQDYQSDIKTVVTEQKEDCKEITTDNDFMDNNDQIANERTVSSAIIDSSHENEIIDYRTSDCESNLNHRLEPHDETKQDVAESEQDAENKDNNGVEGNKVNSDLEVSDKFCMDDLEAFSDTDMDDRKLMEALDAQIGDSDAKNTDVTGDLLDIKACGRRESDDHKNI